MTPNTTRPRRGRPRRIDHSAIGAAVAELGAGNATMRRVADHLGVSLPGLYHHVKNQDELMAVAARHVIAATSPPRHHGEHWTRFLRRYARYIRTALGSEPALLHEFLSGALGDAGEMEYVGESLEALRAQGMTPDQAIAAWAAVTALAMGSVTEAHRERAQRERGRPWPARIVALVADHEAEYPTLRATVDVDPFDDGAYEQRITLLLSGIAAEYGLSVDTSPRSGAPPSHP